MDKKIIIFGAGEIGKKVLQEYGSDNVAFFLDNSDSKRGTFFCEKKIINFEEYLKIAENYQTVIAANHLDSMEAQLRKNGIVNYVIAPYSYNHMNVPKSNRCNHLEWPKYLKELCDFEGKEILEVGSRIVTGANFRNLFERANYTGFDYYEGPNVDVVGDAHKLSTYFDKKFDLVFSSAVMEHLAMPWIASMEMIKLLKPGGYIFCETHYSYASHERPWHFFQFSEQALKVLFPKAAGITCVEAGVSNLLEGRFTKYSNEYLIGNRVPGLYCHSEFLGRKVQEINDFSWEQLELEDIVGESKYPPKK
ncbi:MAG: class I SAM-dependent methyltransferase [Lachnospiraceae bacterium]|nr:class I SAM-dependent methyltransferase [Lachnospiraceae bacterium]